MRKCHLPSSPHLPESTHSWLSLSLPASSPTPHSQTHSFICSGAAPHSPHISLLKFSQLVTAATTLPSLCSFYPSATRFLSSPLLSCRTHKKGVFSSHSLLADTPSVFLTSEPHCTETLPSYASVPSTLPQFTLSPSLSSDSTVSVLLFVSLWLRCHSLRIL